ncbi:UPAR/Ly6 domain-containing protein crok-like [Panulirus ornatus]|uniref:UPAR/Ly6 domain-containing protein crok-like n=1 Tax=Panulirus ornatus TaxID=150431 RepID=UPI003A87762B
MNKSLFGSAVLVTLLGLLVRQGWGIRCWECNSAFDPRCGESHFDSNTLDTVDCDQLNRRHLAGKDAIYCRKIVQSIQNEVRTVRGCGWLEETKAPVGGCYTRTGTKDIMVTYCHCDHDECNSGNTVMASVGLAAVVLMLTKLF